MNTKTFTILGVLIAAGLFGLYSLLSSDGGKVDEKSKNGAPAEITDERQTSAPSPVVVTVLEFRQTEPPIRFSQVCRGIHEAKLDAKRPGRIVNIPVVLGQSVSAGQTLVRLDDDLEKYQLSAAEAVRLAADAAWQKAQLDFQRAEQLHADSLVSESALERSRLTYETARAEKQAALANEQIARKNLSETRITAPTSGEVSLLPYELGETPPPGAAVVEITDRSRLIMDVFLSERNLNSISVGDSAVITAHALPGISFAGVVRAMNPKGDERTKLFKAEVIVENSQLLLRAGQTLTAVFARLSTNDKLIIPAGAIILRGGAPHVALVRDQRASFQLVTLGRRIGSGVTALSGLKTGDRIVVEGAQALADGAPLKVIREISLDSLFN